MNKVTIGKRRKFDLVDDDGARREDGVRGTEENDIVKGCWRTVCKECCEEHWQRFAYLLRLTTSFYYLSL